MIDFTYNYLVIAMLTLFITCLVRGFNGSHYNRGDIIDSLFWPLTFTVLAGVILRVLKNTFEKFTKKEVDEQ